MKHQALMLALLATLGAVLVAGPGMAEQANALTLKNTGPATADASGGDGGDGQDGQDGGDGADGGTAAAIISQFCRNFCPP